jgi:hypothetical protein
MGRYLLLIATLLAAFTTAGAAPPALSGTWVVDPSRSEGLAPTIKGIELTVGQNGDRVEIVDKFTTTDGERTDKDAYTIDGKEAEYTPVIMARFNGGSARNVAVGNGKRVATWAPDANGFDLTETFTVETPMGEEQIQTTRKWRLSADGRTLTIEMVVDQGPPQMRNWKYVYTKQ